MTRDRGSAGARRRHRARRADPAARPQVGGEGDDTLRRRLRAVDRRRRGQRAASRGLVLVRQRPRRRPVGRPRTGCATATWPGGTTGTGRATPTTLEVVAGAFPEPFLHGYDGQHAAGGGAVRARSARGRGARRRRCSERTTSRPLGTTVAANVNLFELVSGSTASHGRPALARDRAVGCGQVLVRGLGRRAARRRLRAEVLEPVSPGPATALLAAVATAAFLIDRIWALAAMAVVLLVICLRAPVQRRWLYVGGALFSAARRDRDLAADVVVGRRNAPVGRPDAARDRPARPLDRRDPDRGRQRAPPRRRRPRLQRLHAPRRPRPAGLGGGLRPAVGARRRPRHPPRSEPRARRGRASRSRCAAAASSCTGVRGYATLLSPLVAGLARTGDGAGRGDGGAWVRAQRGDAGTAARLDVGRPRGARRCSRSRGRCSALWL